MRNLIVNFALFLTFIGYAQFQPAPSFFRTPRALPLVNLNTTSTINVSNYGAVVNDGNNDITAIQNAIQAAINLATAQNPVRLLFENGTYDLMPADGITHSIQMTDANGILWDGQDAEFLVHNPAVGFLSLLRCKNTIIKDISIDYVTLPFTQGIVTNVDVANGFFEFKVDDNFPLPTEAFFSNSPDRWGMFKNSKGGLKKGTRNLISHNRFFELVGTRTYKYGNQNANNLTNVAIGDYFVHIARNNGKTLISNNACKNLTYLNVIGYTSPAGGFNARDSEEWNIINCQIKFKEGRLHTLNADAMHINGGKFGPWVENSLFEGFADDCMNLKYTKRDITTINSPNQITVRSSVAVGENMEFYNPRDGVFLGSATVTNVVNLGGNLFRLTLSNNINITTITDPDHQLADKAYIESRSNESFIFRNNIVRNSRRYGILVQSKYALIENNTFQNLSGSGIRIENGVDWGEGFRANQIEIKGNTFDNCGYDTDYINDLSSATIAVDFRKLGTPCNTSLTWCGTETTNWQGHSNIRVLDNRILYNKRGLFLKNISGLTVTNNFICHNGQDITLGTNGSPIDETIQNSSGISKVDYNYNLPSANIQFKLDESASNADIVNTGSNQNISLSVLTQGGEITQGFSDAEIGKSIKINTAGNGHLRLIDDNTQSPFPGPIGSNARTYAFWIKPAQGIFQTLLYSGGPTDGTVFSVQMQANGVVRVTDNALNIVRMDDLPLDIGVWNHVAISLPKDASIRDVSLYKNGVPSKETFSGNDAKINTASNVVEFFSRFNGIVSDIRYFDYNLCNGDVDRVSKDHQITLSTDEYKINDSKIIVYPTITDNLINFSKPIKSLIIYDILGKTFVKNENISVLNYDVSNLPSGFYFLRINNSQTAKIYKK